MVISRRSQLRYRRVLRCLSHGRGPGRAASVLVRQRRGWIPWRRSVRAARDGPARGHANVAVGAHPGLPDLVGFGRRDMHVTPDEVGT